MSTATQGFDSNDLPIVPGIVSGAGAFVIGYLVTFLLKSGAVSTIASGPNISSWQAVGWIFFDMHNVGTSVTVAGRTVSLSQMGGSLPTDSWMLAVPVVLLLVGGFVVAYTADINDPVEGAQAGAIMAAPYFVLSVLFAFVTTASSSGASVGPSLVMAAILAGIVYPAVLGAIGGAASGALEA